MITLTKINMGVNQNYEKVVNFLLNERCEEDLASDRILGKQNTRKHVTQFLVMVDEVISVMSGTDLVGYLFMSERNNTVMVTTVKRKNHEHLIRKRDYLLVLDAVLCYAEETGKDRVIGLAMVDTKNSRLLEHCGFEFAGYVGKQKQIGEYLWQQQQ